QLRELESEVQRLSSVVEVGQAEITTLSAEFATLREQIGELARAVQTRLAERLAGEKDVERAGQEHARVQRHVETVEVETRQGAREAEETSGTLAPPGQRIAVARDAEGALEAAAARAPAAMRGAHAGEP